MATDPACTRTWSFRPHGIVLLLLGVLAACTTSPDARRPPGPVRIGRELYLNLPQPGELGRAVEAVQLVAAHYGGQTYLFESRISATPDSFTFLGIDTMGRRAMTITWTDTGVIAEKASWLPAALRPENLLADMVLIYWPDDTVRRSLSGGKLLSSTAGRTVFSGGQETIRVDYQPADSDPWNGRLRFRNIAWDYALEIQSRVTP